MKTVPRSLVLDWILTAWKSPPKEMVCLTIEINGEEDEQFRYFKPGRPCAEGYIVLKEQMMIFSKQQNTKNPFEITEFDVEDAQFADSIISDDKEDDVDID